MMSSTRSSEISARQAKERYAAALAERSRRSAGTDYLDLLTWSILRRPVLKPGVPFNIETHLFLADIYRCTARRQVIYKASQMGASEYAISYALHAADERAATGLYIFPTDTHVSDFSTARIGPAIEASPYLESIIVEGGGAIEDGKKKKGADRVTLKRIRDRFLYLRGAQVKPNGQAPQLKSIDADVVIYDEVDEMDPRAPAIGRKRLGHSAIAEERFISTPTYPNFGIHAYWLVSDQREWFIRCEACGERQPLSIHSVVEEFDSLGRPVHWHDYAACSKCKKPLNRLAPGEWVAAYPDRDMAGFHLNKLFSPLVDLAEVVSALDTTDETKRREAYNQDLGEPYTPRGGQITDQVLDECRRQYAHGPVAGERTVMGVDVGKTLHVVIRSPENPETGERLQRFAGEVDSFEELGRVIERYNVGCCVIDALPETRSARKLQEDFSAGRVWLAYYVQQRVGSKRADPWEWDAAKGVVNLDRTRMLDLTLSRFYDHSNTLPANARDIRDYYRHLKASVRVLEDGPNGEKIAMYVNAEPDHFGHAENYCTVASASGGPVEATVVEAEEGQYHAEGRKSAWMR